MAIICSETRSVILLVTYVLLTLAIIPIQLIAVLLRIRLAELLPRFYHRMCASLLGIRVVVRGKQVRERPVLFVANHVSYLDIIALGSVVNGCFIAKAEVAFWPLFGILAKLQRTIFIVRKRFAVVEHSADIANRLESGDNLILFPEGTSGDGTRVMPFKSAFFAVAEHWSHRQPLVIQPVSIAYTMLNEVPLGRSLRPLFAWYGDMDFLPHLWTVAAMGKLTVVIDFHQPLTVAEGGSRKVLASKVQEEVAIGLARANAGR
ncbi:1-acylglycerol-3-phosphate O-acyltransferase [Candidatus Endolissoclinum faulkneri L5]|uniref:1-acylglycerol-3-phosphate O-acyltransferase n=1 Tax=Candidatus Endolissoclinum faulkneri L5 TaxID=1401328 RepID=V9TR77_9PROT|nr:lysophospholipid acyltransferase family protein [Candidatus Endolissoclinum faulkneri]AHC73404.1 1-acylglycerol-3-phosphate O-acyltransferase [Candidatus Endolissoclinum faulkneri L5]